MNDFQITLEAIIDQSSLTKAQKQVAKDRLKINADIEIDKKTYSEIRSTLREISNLTIKKEKLNPKIDTRQFEILSKQIADVTTRYEALLEKFWKNPKNLEVFNISDIQKITEAGYAIDQFKAKVEDAAKRKVVDIEFGINTEKYSTEVAKAEKEISKFGTKSGGVFSEARKAVDSLGVAYKEMSTIVSDTTGKFSDEDKIASEQRYHQALEKTKNLLSQINLDKDNQIVHVGDEKRVNMINTLNNYLAKNTAMSSKSRKEIEKWIATLASSDDMTVGSIKNINTQFQTLDAQLRKTGQLGLSFKDKIGQAWEKFGGWSLATGTLTSVVSKTRSAIGEIKELDNILTEISKTSDLTATQLEKLGDSAFNTASEYGKKASDYLTGVQEMYRAGFDNAEDMAELSVLAQSAGDMDSTLANDYIIATNAAYKYKGSVEDLNKVLDSQNYITNNAAISMKDIADATTETASVAAQYGVEIDELSALIATATANTRESGSEVGTALKAILINLQDTTSEPVTETFDALGISMTKVVDGAEKLKTPIELIYELAEAYNSLPEGDAMRANILNEIGQKRHANTLAAILSDMESFEGMLDLYNDSSANGSAMREAEKSASNLQGALNKLSNTWTDIVDNVFNSKGLTTAVNLLNELLKLVNGITDTLGSWGTIGLGLGAFLSSKDVGTA